MAETTRITVNLHAGLAGRLAVHAEHERRSLSATAALLIEEALVIHGVEPSADNGGEPSGAIRSALHNGATDPPVAPGSSGASPPPKFKPDPKPGH